MVSRNTKIPTYLSILAAAVLGWHSQADASPLEQKVNFHFSLPSSQHLSPASSPPRLLDQIVNLEFDPELMKAISDLNRGYELFMERERRIEQAYHTYANREGMARSFTYTIHTKIYQSLIQKSLDLAKQRYNVDIPYSLFVSLIQGESSWHTHVTSSAGAQGLGQLMPGTAQTVGYLDRTSPNQLLAVAIILGSTYHKYEQEFPDITEEQRWDWVLVGYNYGMNGIPYLARSKGVKSYWELTRKDLGREAYEFVGKIRGIERAFLYDYNREDIS